MDVKKNKPSNHFFLIISYFSQKPLMLLTSLSNEFMIDLGKVKNVDHQITCDGRGFRKTPRMCSLVSNSIALYCVA